MMVESRNHRLLSFFSLSLCVSVCFFREGGQDADGGAAAPPPRFFGDAFRSWVIPYGPLLRRLWLLLSPTLFDRRAMTLPPKARSTPRLSRSLLFIIDRGWGGVYGYIGLFYGSSLGTSDWVRGALQTRTIRG